MSLLCPAGKRWSTACAYLHPALSRPNLTAEAQTFVSRVLFEGTRAVGVEYIKNGQTRRVSELPPGQGRGDGRGGALTPAVPPIPFQKLRGFSKALKTVSVLQISALHCFPLSGVSRSFRVPVKIWLTVVLFKPLV